VSIYSSTFPPHPLTPTPSPLVPPYKRGEDRGCFAFVAWGRTEDASLSLHGRRGTALTPIPSPRRGRGAGGADRCRFFTVRLGQDKEGKGDKRTREENRTESCSVKLTSKSRNARFFVLTLPCLLVYLSTLSYLNLNLKKPTLVRAGGEGLSLS
jgi:hypothetical protein